MTESEYPEQTGAGAEKFAPQTEGTFTRQRWQAPVRIPAASAEPAPGGLRSGVSDPDGQPISSADDGAGTPTPRFAQSSHFAQSSPVSQTPPVAPTSGTAGSATTGSPYTAPQTFAPSTSAGSGSRTEAGSSTAPGARAAYASTPAASTVPVAGGGSGSGGGRPPIPRRNVAPRRGPGWGGTIVGMVITGLVTLAVVFGVWGAQSPFSASADMTGASDEGTSGNTFTQSGAEVVEPVDTIGGVPDWEAVAAAVRPATVSIFVSGENEAASGSGVIIDNAGYIITNQHVVSGYGEGGSITVTLHDGRVYSATIVGGDTTTDLAVIVLDTPPSDLTAALLGDSAKLAVGEPVMAIGAPLGLADTVTTGIISALDRPVAVSGGTDSQTGQADVVVTNAIQIDASINPGNSGGPLFNASGAVIGINSSIASLGTTADEAGSIGLGFAIPVNLAKSVAAQIIETGTAQHAMLGVQIGTGVVQVGDDSRLGAVVAAVTPGGAAEGAGVLEGDVIVGIDGNSVTSGPALTGYVRRYTAGDQVVLDVARDGAIQQLTVTLQQK